MSYLTAFSSTGRAGIGGKPDPAHSHTISSIQPQILQRRTQTKRHIHSSAESDCN
ncbi:hypothetical protein [Myxacorys almedinensis]|uniref:Uncharacterized protein n=1 Tax=Myxacorys almedinensis A TaxID=2690445 RepID=A0A8J8CJB0_9CYAN|nr:hypothetical protein [Myxacorys almedinensis]NDJ17421.1 hypothetical protein [Myxacorys almedinensis A]